MYKCIPGTLPAGTQARQTNLAWLSLRLLLTQLFSEHLVMMKAKILVPELEQKCSVLKLGVF